MPGDQGAQVYLSATLRTALDEGVLSQNCKLPEPIRLVLSPSSGWDSPSAGSGSGLHIALCPNPADL